MAHKKHVENRIEKKREKKARKKKEAPSAKPLTVNKPGKIDPFLLFTVAVLIIFGLIMLFSASSYTAQIKHNDAAFFVKKQLVALGVGVFGLIAATFIPYKVWNHSKISMFIFVVSIIVLFMVLSPIGIEANGAKRWIDLKVFTLQPSEVVKVALILITAAMICKYYKQLSNGIVYTTILVFTLAAAGLTAIVTDDLGTAIIMFGMGLVMLFVTCPVKMFTARAAAFVAVVGAFFIAIKPYRLLRIKAWLNVEAYADKESYQVMQGLYAIGSGGLFGKGLGKSTQKLSFVPEAQTDMIYSIIVEELGIIGGAFLIVLFAILIWRLWKIYKETENTFGKLIVAGVATHMALQTFINMAVVTSLIPNTGVPLPFISYGGSSIIMLLAEIGLVLSVCRGNEQKVVHEEREILEDKDQGVIYYQ